MSADPLRLEYQLDPAAAADDAWLRAKAKSRYQGVARDELGVWWATVLRLRTYVQQDGRVERLTHVWFPGTTAAEALARARRWVEEQLATAKAGGRRAA